MYITVANYSCVLFIKSLIGLLNSAQIVDASTGTAAAVVPT